MKLKVFLLLMLLSVVPLRAQEPRQHTIFDALKRGKVGEGVVIIIQSPAIEQLVGRPNSRLAGALVVNGYAILQGYKIQVYSGNLQNSRAIANARCQEVNALFPELGATVEYNAPFWRVRVGNFVEHTEAQARLTALQKAFPAFSREMYIVRAQIKVAQ